MPKPTTIQLLRSAVLIKRHIGKKRRVRYSTIFHIEHHHEALNILEEKNAVTTMFSGHKVYIERNWEW